MSELFAAVVHWAFQPVPVWMWLVMIAINNLYVLRLDWLLELHLQKDNPRDRNQH